MLSYVSILADHFAAILTAIVTPLVFWWFARKFPAQQLSVEGPTLDELTPLFRKWEVVFALAYAAMWLPVSAAVYAPLHFLAQWRARSMREDPSTFVFYADGPALWLPALFMGLLLSAYLLLLLSKGILKHRYSDYERYTALRFGFDQNRVLKFFAVGITAVFVTAVWMLFDTYVVASPNDLRVNSLLGRERRYHYTNMTSIVTAPASIAPSGKTVFRRISVLKFKDGSVFSTDSIPPDEIAGRSQSALMQAIVARTGVQPSEKAVFQRGERWGKGL